MKVSTPGVIAPRGGEVISSPLRDPASSGLEEDAWASGSFVSPVNVVGIEVPRLARGTRMVSREIRYMCCEQAAWGVEGDMCDLG